MNEEGVNEGKQRMNEGIKNEWLKGWKIDGWMDGWINEWRNLDDFLHISI